MKINLVAYGIAKDIIGSNEVELLLEQVKTTSDLKAELSQRYPDFQKLAKFSLAVNEEYREDNFLLSDGDEVVIIPPVSGG